MNFRVIARLLGLLLAIFGASMLPSVLWSFYYDDGSHWALIISSLITLAFGGVLFFWGSRKKQEIFKREATAIVGLGWLLAALFGALPYFFADLAEMPTFADCYFESMSGLTTTGASVLSDIESVPKGILFWRSFTHWLGGLGIVMLFVAILPFLGAGGRALVKSEVTGPVKDGLTPRIKDTAQLLYKLYIGYTIAETALLMFAGMSFFDALCHTFGTLATGGFSTRNASIAAFDSVAIELIIIVFMFLAGTNFALMYGFFRGRSRNLFKDYEWRVYFGIIAVCSAAMTLGLYRNSAYETFEDCLRNAVFTVLSIITTTGFVTGDFEPWPAGIKALIFCLMFVGGCAGSTGGGMKVMRWITLVKIGRANVEKIFRPRTIRKLKMGDAIIPEDLQQSTLGFLVLWMLVFAAGTILIGVTDNRQIDLITSLSVINATLNNIGPGFGQISATSNYGFFTPASKWLLSLIMVLGRLELYSIMVLFIPRFWKVE